MARPSQAESCTMASRMREVSAEDFKAWSTTILLPWIV
jgi:hypothetical protein